MILHCPSMWPQSLIVTCKRLELFYHSEKIVGCYTEMRGFKSPDRDIEDVTLRIDQRVISSILEYFV